MAKLSGAQLLMLADEQTSPEQFAILRNMTGQRRLQLAEQMFWTARKLKAAGVRYQHPDWPEEKVMAEVNRILLDAGK
ncbi:MAG TPA: hypothetical protein VKV04_15800 [Verrucomicrobiae bacterium]|nr:hypothetical protein [Verrucomicrobiae bacterium]